MQRTSDAGPQLLVVGSQSRQGYQETPATFEFNIMAVIAFFNNRIQVLEGQLAAYTQRTERLETEVQGLSGINRVLANDEAMKRKLAAKDQQLEQVRLAHTQEILAKDQQLEQVRLAHTQEILAKDQQLEQVRGDAVRDLADQREEVLIEKEAALEAQELAFKAEVTKTGMYAIENVDLFVKTGNFLLKKNGLDFVLPNVPNYVKGFVHFTLALKNYDYSGSVTALASTAVFNAKLFSDYLIPQWLQDGYQDVVTEYPYAKCIVDGGIAFASNAAIFSPQAALPYAALTAASCAAEIAQPGTGSYVSAATSSLKMMCSGNVVTKAIDALAIIDTLDAYDGVADFVSVVGSLSYNMTTYAIADSE